MEAAMTINEAIAYANVALAVGLLALGTLLCWQAATRRSFWSWPPSALVALGLGFLLPGLVSLQQVFFRVGDLPSPLDRNEWGTLAFRVLVAAYVLGLLMRVWRGKLLTGRDRRRIAEGSG